MLSSKPKSQAYLRSNKIRTRLLLEANGELQGFKKSSKTKINNKTISQKDKEFSDITIHLTEFHSNRNIRRIVNEDYKLIDKFMSKLNFASLNYVNNSNSPGGDFQKYALKKKQSISDRKIMNFELKVIKGIISEEPFEELKNTIMDSKLNTKTFYQVKQQFPTIEEDASKLSYQYNNKVDEILEFLNVEKGFFENYNTHKRAKASFYFLKSLAHSLKIIPLRQEKPNHLRLKKKETIGFSQVQNIMILKENIDETKLRLQNKKDNPNSNRTGQGDNSFRGQILRKLSSRHQAMNSCHYQKKNSENLDKIPAFDLKTRRGSLLEMKMCLDLHNEIFLSFNNSREMTSDTKVNTLDIQRGTSDNSVDDFKINLILLK